MKAVHIPGISADTAIEGKTLHVQSHQYSLGGGSARSIQNWMMRARLYKCNAVVVHLPRCYRRDEIRGQMSKAAFQLNLNMSRSVNVTFVDTRLEV